MVCMDRGQKCMPIVKLSEEKASVMVCLDWWQKCMPIVNLSEEKASWTWRSALTVSVLCICSSQASSLPSPQSSTSSIFVANRKASGSLSQSQEWSRSGVGMQQSTPGYASTPRAALETLQRAQKDLNSLRASDQVKNLPLLSAWRPEKLCQSYEERCAEKLQSSRRSLPKPLIVIDDDHSEDLKFDWYNVLGTDTGRNFKNYIAAVHKLVIRFFAQSTLYSPQKAFCKSEYWNALVLAQIANPPELILS